MSYHPIANQIYNLLIQDKITEQKGEITFDFLQMPIKINRKDGIGNLFEEWFSRWMKVKGIYFITRKNTQKFPDFLLDKDSEIKGLLEIKTFSKNPAFDLGNFKAYCNSLTTEGYRLDADYLIFDYQLEKSKFQIKQIWLKKIWEVTGKSEDYPITHQKKGGKDQKPEDKQIYTIRPSSKSTWDSPKDQFFQSRLDFVNALYNTLMQYYDTKNKSSDWLEKVKNNYLCHTGEEL